jgi:hydroxyethylthiazole kinase-like uncharacterized protein yjeF
MPRPAHHLPVTTAQQAAARDRAAIAAGIPSFDLMARAGTATAAIILRDFASSLSDGVAIFAGAGNNGGDAYVVAAQLVRAGIGVRLHAAEPPRTPDATRAAALVSPLLVHGEPTGNERIAIDGLLGTGHQGALRGSIATACERLSRYRDANTAIVALDVPSGLDAATGDIATGSVAADATLSYGTFKRGQLIARAHVGRLLLVDIGLDGHAHQGDGAWLLAECIRCVTSSPPCRGIRGKRDRASWELPVARVAWQAQLSLPHALRSQQVQAWCTRSYTTIRAMRCSRWCHRRWYTDIRVSSMPATRALQSESDRGSAKVNRRMRCSSRC